MAGDYHGLLLQAAVGSALGLLAFFALCAWNGASAADGSILAARLAQRLPGFLPISTAAALWYAAAEFAEPSHAAASWIAVAFFLAAGSALLRLLGLAALAVFAEAVIAVFGTPFAPRAPSWLARTRTARPVRRILWARRRFARPPPIGLRARA